MFLFFQNSANDNDNDVDNNANNKDRNCHDSESSSEYESDMSDDGIDALVQPQQKYICGRGLVRIRGGRFCRCGRISAHGQRAEAVPRVANQPVTWSDITDFEIPNIDELFHENEGLDRLSMLAETPLDCLQLFFFRRSIQIDGRRK